jgi:hypothetical protein
MTEPKQGRDGEYGAICNELAYEGKMISLRVGLSLPIPMSLSNSACKGKAPVDDVRGFLAKTGHLKNG